MANGLSFFLKLQDLMSGPALKAAAAVDQLGASLKAADTASRARVESAGPKVGKLDFMDAAGPVRAIKLTEAELDKLKLKLRDDMLAVTNLTASFRALQAATKQDLPTMKLVNEELQKRRDALAQTQKQLALSGNAAKFGSEGTNRLTATLKNLAEAGGGSSEGLGVLQDATSGLKEVLTQLNLTLVTLDQHIAKMGGHSRIVSGLISGAAAGVGEKLVEAAGEKMGDGVKEGASELFGKASDALKNAFENKSGLKASIGNALSNVSKLVSETLGGSISIETLGAGTAALGTLGVTAIGVTASLAALAAVVTGLVAGVALLATGVAALGVAFAGLVIDGAKVAIEANQAKGDTMEMLELMLGTAEAAEDAYDQIHDITRELGITMSDASTLAQELTAAGIDTASGLTDAMKAIATVDSIVKGKGDNIKNIIEKALASGKFEVNAKKLIGTGVKVKDLYEQISKSTGEGLATVKAKLEKGKIDAEVGIDALTKVIDQKFGALARSRARGFDESMARLKDSIHHLFEDVNIEPFEKALAKIVDLFGDGTVSGEAMHGVITDFFDAVFEKAAKVFEYLRIGLKGLVLVGLKVAVAFEPLLIQLGLLAPASEDGQESMEGMIDAMLFAGDAAGGLASMLAGIAESLVSIGQLIPFKFMFDTIVQLIGPIAQIPTFLSVAAFSFGLLVAKAKTAFAELVPAAISAGGNLMRGLAQGITDTIGVVLDAVKNVADKAVALFKNKWEIHSPSGVGEDLGGNLSLGVAKGIDLKARVANDNFQRLVALPGGLLTRGQATPDVPVQVPQRQSAQAQGGGRTISVDVTVEAGAIVVQGSTTQEVIQGLRDQLGPLLADLLEQAMLEAGLDPTGSD